MVWVGRRGDAPNAIGGNQDNWWQMPQGGIDTGEAPDEAALRELHEETSVNSARIIAEAPEWYSYDFPGEVLKTVRGGKFRGQTQKWFAVRFTGTDDEIDIAAPAGHKPEFDQWRWAGMDELVDMIIPFKRDVYKQVVAAFSNIRRSDR